MFCRPLGSETGIWAGRVEGSRLESGTISHIVEKISTSRHLTTGAWVCLQRRALRPAYTSVDRLGPTSLTATRNCPATSVAEERRLYDLSTKLHVLYGLRQRSLLALATRPTMPAPGTTLPPRQLVPSQYLHKSCLQFVGPCGSCRTSLHHLTAPHSMTPGVRPSTVSEDQDRRLRSAS